MVNISKLQPNFIKVTQIRSAHHFAMISLVLGWHPLPLWPRGYALDMQCFSHLRMDFCEANHRKDGCQLMEATNNSSNVALGRLKSQKHSCFHVVLWLLSGVDYLVGGTLARHGSLSWQSSSMQESAIHQEKRLSGSGSFTPWQSLTEDIGFGWSWWWCWAAVAGNSVRPCPSIGICWPSHGCTTTFVRPTGSYWQFPPTCTANSCWDVFLWRCFRHFQSFVSSNFCWLQIADACCRSTSHRPLESDLCQVRKNPKVHAGAPLFSICENLHTKLLGGGGPERKQRFVFRKLVLAAKAERKAYCKVSESLKSPLVRYDSWGLWLALACRCTTTPWYFFWFLRSLGVFSHHGVPFPAWSAQSQRIWL